LNEEQNCVSGARGLPGRALSEHGAHQNAEIEPGNVDQIALVNVLATAQSSSQIRRSSCSLIWFS
jgi:hypothetical protein